MEYKIQNLEKSYGKLNVFKNFTMRIPKSKITCILGPSGCGKTTLLNILSGILQPDSGSILGIEKQTISYLFQEPRLLDWKTVRGNIEFVLKGTHSKKERHALASKYIRIVGLQNFEDYYPSQLSGGMIQRVAIARAFAYPSEILLMDEPFKGLDIHMKKSVMHAFINLWEKDLRTVLFVTHDIEDAVSLGDEIYLLSSLPAQIRKHFTIHIPQRHRSETLPQIQEIIAQIRKEFEK